MGLVRKYFPWMIIGVVLLVEAVALFFVLSKQAAANASRTRLEERRTARNELRRRTTGIEERIAIHHRRKDLVQQELGDCALFLWHGGDAIEGLFNATELASYDACPWETPRNFDVFKVAYANVYDQDVEKLEPLMRKANTNRTMLGLADPAGLAQATVTIGDIYAMQKEFWIKKALVEVLAKSDAVLQSITVAGPAGEARRGTRHAAAKGAAEPGKLSVPLSVQWTFACDYTRLSGLLEDLLASRVCFRIVSVSSVVRAVIETEAAPAAAPPEPAAKGAPSAKEAHPPGKTGKEAEEAAKGGVVRRRKYVAVTMTGEVPDIQVDVQEVLFPKPEFPGKAKVAEWVDRQTRSLEVRRKRLEVPHAAGGAAGEPVAKRPEPAVPWISRELQALQKVPPADADKPVTVTDELGVKREYVFDTVEAAREWLTRRFDFERARIDAHLELWARVRRMVASGKADEKTRQGVFDRPDGMAVSFRPADQFDPGQIFVAAFEPGVQAKLGLVTRRTEESHEGVKRATGTGKR